MNVNAGVAAGLGAALALLLAGGIVSYRATAALVEANRAEAAAHQVLAAASDLRGHLTAAESARRGYVLTGDGRFEDAYRAAKAGAEASDPGPLVRRRLAQLDESMSLHGRRPDAREAQAALTQEGRRLMEAVEAQIAETERVQQEILHARARQADRSARLARRMVPAATALALALIGASGFLLLREAARSRRARDELHRSEARYRAVLSHFPNGAVFLYDRDLRYRLVEGAGLADVGLSKEGLEGRTIGELFPAETLAHIEAPYRAALEGKSSVLEAPYGGHLYVVRITPIRDETGAVTHGLVVTQDVTHERAAGDDNRRLTRELERAMAEMTTANEELEAFSYSVSHDLRAPLRQVHGFVDLLRRSSYDRLDEEGRGQLDTIARAARTMGDLIDDLLAFSRLSRAAPRREPVDLGVLVREVVKPPGPDEGQARVEWRIGTLPVVWADPALLRIVLTNLVGNAVKYSRTRPHPRVEVDASPDQEGQAVVYVRDNGVGFDMEYAGRLFGVFQRLHRAEEFEGTGIGLATVRRIVHRHGGRTWAESRPDEGATFYFSLPRPEAAAPAAAERSTP